MFADILLLTLNFGKIRQDINPDDEDVYITDDWEPPISKNLNHSSTSTMERAFKKGDSSVRASYFTYSLLIY